MAAMEREQIEADIRRRAGTLLQEQQSRVASDADRLFAVLMPVQWLVAMVFALVVSPQRWEGMQSGVHIHVWTALIVGGAITLFPTFMALKRTGQVATRYVVACAQMLMSALLIHLSGGRIETHFHVFGSLAFLAFAYRDWRVLIPATVTIAVDHLARGVFWPYSVFGVLTASPWRAIEHAAWVIFEDVILIRACLLSVAEMRLLADNQARLEDVNQNIESRVMLRTAELRDNEELLRGVLAGAPVALIEVDESGRCLYVNESGLKLAGVRQDKLVGQSWTDALHPDDRAAAARMAGNGGGVEEFRASGGGVKVRVRVGEAGRVEGTAARVIAMDKVA